ncbi:MFS transporter [Marimonas sp. MJW-29]|uniref:MFS transporter n=1 Tax=Sulfitobacter sediminis TaxID=3234186 RepID=A0ABV3RKK7_9RHOB
MRAASHDPLLIPLLSLGNFVVGVAAFSIVGILEPLGADLGQSAAAAGQLLTVYALAYAILSPLMVALSGRIGRRRVLTAAALLIALAAAISALAPDFAVLNIGRIIAAAGAGIFTPVAAAVAATLSPEDRRAKVLAAVFFGFTISQVMGVPIGSWIAYTFGWRWTFWLVTLLALPVALLIWLRVPAGLKFQPVRMQDLGEVILRGRVMLAVLFTSTFLGATYVLYTYIAPLLSQTMGYGRDGIAFILLVFGCGAVCGNMLGGYLADRFGWRVTLAGLCLTQIVIMPLYSLLPVSTAVLIAMSFFWSFFGWAFMAGQQMRLVGMAGSQAPVVLALNAAAIYIGAAVGSALGGLVIATFGIIAIGLAAGIAAALALLHLEVSARLSPAPATPS